jgi:hypothetical protein
MISFACIAVTSRFYRKESEVRRKSVKLLSFESFPHECGRRMSIRLPGRATLAHSLTLEGRAWLNADPGTGKTTASQSTPKMARGNLGMR